MDSETERRLIDRCRGGSTSAFEPLVKAHEAQALAIAEALLGDADDAEDAVQDAFVKAFRSLKGLAPGSAFGPWFRSILRNRCIDMLRSAPRRRRTSWSDVAEAEVPSNEPTGIMLLEQAQLSAAIHAALAQLSTEHREVLVLKEIEGMSYAELAQTIHIPPGTVASRLFHARQALRQVLLADRLLLDGARP